MNIHSQPLCEKPVIIYPKGDVMHKADLEGPALEGGWGRVTPAKRSAHTRGSKQFWEGLRVHLELVSKCCQGTLKDRSDTE